MARSKAAAKLELTTKACLHKDLACTGFRLWGLPYVQILDGTLVILD
jgi:hypothetical protein